MPNTSKKYVDALKQFDREKFHTPAEAVEVVKNLSNRKFDESVDLVVRLGVDPRKADQMVRGTVALPSGSGKDVRVAVFAQGDAATAAQAAGAEYVGAEDLAAQVEGGMLDFDVAIATPDLMPLVGKLGRVLVVGGVAGTVVETGVVVVLHAAGRAAATGAVGARPIGTFANASSACAVARRNWSRAVVVTPAPSAAWRAVGE